LPFFTPPTVDDLSAISYDPGLHPLALRVARHMGNNPRGRTVVKNSDNTYTTYDVPSQDTLSAAKVIAWPDGTKAPGYYIGGHRYEITNAEKADLQAAGLTVEG
jgi:hypothetical protein